MRRGARSSLAVALLATLAITVGGKAFAYFTGAGSGSASAAVTSLGSPTISAATAAAGGTVTLTWSAVTPPGSGTVNYYVTRDGGQPAGNCPSVEEAAAVTTCEDAAVPIGEHTYRVVASWRHWSAVSAAKAATVTVGAAVKFTISGSTTTPVAGAAVNLTITAKDVDNSTVSTYAGTHDLVFSGASSSPGGNAPTVADSSGTAVSFGSATALSFSSGVATVGSGKNGVLHVYNAAAANITATEGSLTTPAALSLTVSPGSASKFVLSAATTTPAAGASDELTVRAQDAYGNAATSYTGSHSLVFSGANSSAGGNAPTVTNSSGTAIAFGSATAIAFTAGVAESSKGAGGKAVLYKVETASLKATEGSITTPTGLSVTPTPGTASKLALSASTTTPTAGTGFNLTTTAQDAYGNTATAYSGAKSITFGGAAASPSGTLPTVVNSAGTAINFGSATSLSFTSGVASVSSSKNGFAKLYNAVASSVTASDGTISTPTALALTVSAGTATRVALSELVASAGAVVGSPCLFTCSVTTLGSLGTIKAKATITDANGNVVSNLGSAKSVTVTGGTGSTVSGSPLSVPATGSAVSSTEFTYTAPALGSFSQTITLASTGFTSATISASK